MAFTVIYDACVLFPPKLRQLLLGIAQRGIVRARWSEHIVDECIGSIQKTRPDLTSESLIGIRAGIINSVSDCLVVNYESLIAGVHLPDRKDAHVVAAAVRAGAQTIVTSNISDFPEDALAPYNLEARHPDDFVVDQIHLDSGAVLGAFMEIRDRYKNPPLSHDDVLDALERYGMVQTVSLLRTLLPR